MMLSFDSGFLSGISYLDKLYPSGVNKPGVYGIIGPTGVGKSVLSGMVGLDTVFHRYSFGEELGKVKPWVYFDLHNGMPLFRDRIYGHAKELRKAILDKLTDFRTRALFREQIPTDKEFCAHNDLFLGSNFYCFADRPDLAMFGISRELVSVRRDLGQKSLWAGSLGGIVIDGASHLWYAMESSVPYSEYDFLKVHLPMFLRKLSDLYACPVWITHQVTGEACDRDSIDLLHHRDARGCKDFAESFDACFVLGNPNPDPDNSVFTIRCTQGVSFAEQKKMCLLKFRDGGHSIEEVEAQVADAKTRMWKRKPSQGAVLSNYEHTLLDNEIRELELKSGGEAESSSRACER